MAEDKTQAAMLEAGAERVREAFQVQYELGGLPMSEAAGVMRARRAAGRPVGARNKREEDVARAVIERLGDPLLTQAAIATMPIDELALAAGCSRFEAMQERRLAAAIVIPFLHQRQPLAINVSNRQVVHLVIGQVDAATEDSVAVNVVDVVDYQQVSNGEPDAV